MRRIIDISDNTEVRQTAIGVLLSWEPDEGFWQQMAALTWREKSKSMVAFISSTIHGVANFDNPKFTQQYVFIIHLIKI